MQYIAVVLVGLLMGNFATTVLYRLPRGIALSGFDKGFPFCSWCKHRLKFYEYLPLISWVTTLGYCNYCKAKINRHYIAIELLATAFSVICYMLYGLSDTYVVMLIFGLCCVTSAFIYLEHGVIMPLMTASITILGCIYRTLIDRSIFTWLLSLGIAAVFSLVLLRQSPKANSAKQDLIHALIPASVWCFGYATVSYVGILLALYLFIRKSKLYPCSIIILYLISVVSI